MFGFAVPPSCLTRGPFGRGSRGVIGFLAAFVLLAVAAPAADAVPRRAADGTLCTRYASPSGSNARSGSASRPFRTVQRLIDSLRPGQTGCLLRGTYSGGAVFSRDRVKIASAAGPLARLRGYVWIKDSANGVTISHLRIDGHDSPRITVMVLGDGALLRRLNITNRNKLNSTSTGSCVLLGVDGAPAFGPRVVSSRIHNCGGGNGGHDHAIYSEFTRRAVIRNNYLYDNPGFGISMYPDSQQALIEYNVIDGNGYENRSNVTFSGEEAGGEYDRDYASSNNVLRRNIITNARARYNIDSYYPSLQPVGNLVADNCVWNAPRGNFGGRSAYRLSGNRAVRPLFRDRAHKDFRLRRGSPCRAWGPRVTPVRR